MFIGLVLVHEWGHYIAARRNGVEVEEFGLFFPPRAKVLGRRKGTEYTLNWLPLGGFVKLKGENDADTRPGTFGAATTWVKTKIMLAGVAMNLLTAFVLLTLLALIGMPKLIDNQFTVASDTKIIRHDVLVGHVEPGSPADKAGVKQVDKLISIGLPGEKTEPIKEDTDLKKLTGKYAGQKVMVQYERDGQSIQRTIQLRTKKEVEKSRKTDEPKGNFGVTPIELTVQRSTWSAPVVAAGLVKQITELSFKGLGTSVAGLGKTIAGFVTGNTPARQAGQEQTVREISGPIGIFFALKFGAELGILLMLFIIALISLSLAIMNVLPIPALDGGRLFVLLGSRALKKPLSKETEEAIQVAGFIFIVSLIILISIVDVQRFF